VDHKRLDDWLAHIDQVLAKHPVGYPKLTPEENKRLIRGFASRAWIAGPQMTQWVRTTAYYTARLALLGMEASDAECTVFWLRLYGLFDEVRDGLGQQIKAMEDFFAMLPIPEELQRQLHLQLGVDALLKRQLAPNALRGLRGIG
jgi:hypothetical protein